MAAAHLVADGNLAFLSYVYPHQFIYAGRQFVTVVTAEYFHVHYFARFAMRHAQRCIPHFSRFFAENCPQEPFFGCKLRFAFWRNFSHQYIAGANVRTNVNYAAFVQIFQRILSHVWYVAGYFLRT